MTKNDDMNALCTNPLGLNHTLRDRVHHYLPAPWADATHLSHKF